MRGRDITRYGYEFNDLWLINTHNGIKEKNIAPIDINDYPAIKAHLDKFWEKLSTRADKGDTPYNLRNCVYTDDFSKQKIVWGEISDKPKFAIDIYGSYYISNTVFMMTGSNLPYITAILNSPLSEYYFSQVATTTGEGTVRWLKYKIECFPIPPISSIQNDEFEKMIISEEHSESWYSKIEQMVYRLYNMTSEEIAYISDYLSRDKM